MVYNIAVVADYFCVTQLEIEELYNLTSIIKNLKVETDFVNAFFIQAKGNKDSLV